MIGLVFGLLGVMLAYSLPTLFDLRKIETVPSAAVKWVNCTFCDTPFAAKQTYCPYCDAQLQLPSVLPEKE